MNYGAQLEIELEINYDSDDELKETTIRGINTLDDEQFKTLFVILGDARKENRIRTVQANDEFVMYSALEEHANEINEEVRDRVFYEFDDLTMFTWPNIRVKIKKNQRIA